VAATTGISAVITKVKGHEVFLLGREAETESDMIGEFRDTVSGKKEIIAN
jgi:hypothetical protein